MRALGTVLGQRVAKLLGLLCRTHKVEYFLPHMVITDLIDITPIRIRIPLHISILGISNLRQKRRRVLGFTSLELNPQILPFRCDNTSPVSSESV